MTGLLPHYLSTACWHEHHSWCRLFCKYCSQPCVCDCHADGPEARLLGWKSDE